MWTSWDKKSDNSGTWQAFEKYTSMSHDYRFYGIFVYPYNGRDRVSKERAGENKYFLTFIFKRTTLAVIVENHLRMDMSLEAPTQHGKKCKKLKNS
jgi:hypothetical protein